MGFSLRGFLKGAVDDINPFDHGKSHGNPQGRPQQPAPASTATPQYNNGPGLQVQQVQQPRFVPPPPVPSYAPVQAPPQLSVKPVAVQHLDVAPQPAPVVNQPPLKVTTAAPQDLHVGSQIIAPTPSYVIDQRNKIPGIDTATQYKLGNPQFGHGFNNDQIKAMAPSQAPFNPIKALPSAFKDAVNQVLVQPAVKTVQAPYEAARLLPAELTHNDQAITNATNALHDTARGSFIGPLAQTAELAGATLGANSILNNPNASPELKQRQLQGVNEALAPIGFNLGDTQKQTNLKGASLIAQDIAVPALSKGGTAALKSVATSGKEALARGATTQLATGVLKPVTQSLAETKAGLANTAARLSNVTTSLVKPRPLNEIGAVGKNVNEPNAQFIAGSPDAQFASNLAEGYRQALKPGVEKPSVGSPDAQFASNLAKGYGQAIKTGVEKPKLTSAQADANYRDWLGKNPKALAEIQDRIATADTIAPQYRAKFLKDAKREIDNKYIKQYSETLKPDKKPLITPLNESGFARIPGRQPKSEAPIVGPNLSRSSKIDPSSQPLTKGKANQPELTPQLKPLSPSSSGPIVPQVAEDVSRALKGNEVKQRGFAASMAESTKTPAKIAKFLDNQKYTTLSDKERIALAREHIKSNPADAEARALNPQSSHDVTVGNQLIDHYIAHGQLDKLKSTVTAMNESGTELGRAVHAFADYDKTTPGGAVKFAETTINQYNKLNPKKQLQLGENDIKNLVSRAQGIQKMNAGRKRNIASHQLMEDVNNLIPSTIADKAVTVWKAGLLTSPRTTMRNVVGNTLHGVAETIKDAPAALNDILLQQKTGARSMTLTTKGSIKGAKEGFQGSKDMMSFGFDPSNMIDKYDVRHVTWDKTPTQTALKHYTNFVFRAMGAQDQPFYHAAFARSLYDQAGAAAINAGKRGDKAFIEKAVKAPTEEMKIAATKDATTATFKNPNQLRDLASEFKNKLGKTQTGKVISEVVAPFTGVPSSIAGQIVEYSPIGLLKGLKKDYSVISRAMKNPTAKDLPALQRAASQEIGRGTIGTGLVGIGAYLTTKGLMTGNPKDAQEAEQWKLEGKQANSVFVGGKWRSINSIGPESLVVLAGSKGVKARREGAGPGELGAQIGKDFTQQTFLQGVQGPLNAVTDPKRYGSTYVRGQAASVVPNIVKDTAKAGDKTQRETNSVKDALKASIPGARNTLLPKRDALGNPLKQEPAGLGNFVDLFNSKTPIKNPVVNELSRLYSVDQSATPSKLGKSQTILGQKLKLTPEQLDQLEQTSGAPIRQQFADLIKSSDYKSASDDVKKKALDSIVENARSGAKLQLGTGSNNTSNGIVDQSKLSSKAKETLAKDSFSKSGKSYDIVGDTVYRKSSDGTISTTPKIKYDYAVGTATLTQRKSNGDVSGWLNTAASQLASIEKQLKDPNVDPLDVITLQNDAAAIQKNVDKYKGYGGFTKPKTGRGRGGRGGSRIKQLNYGKLATVGKANTSAIRNLVKQSRIKHRSKGAH